jgi:hypothetical protein
MSIDAIYSCGRLNKGICGTIITVMIRSNKSNGFLDDERMPTHFPPATPPLLDLSRLRIQKLALLFGEDDDLVDYRDRTRMLEVFKEGGVEKRIVMISIT